MVREWSLGFNVLSAAEREKEREGEREGRREREREREGERERGGGAQRKRRE